MKEFLHTYLFAIPVLILGLIFVMLDILYPKFEKINKKTRDFVHKTRNEKINNFMIYTHKVNDVLTASLIILVFAFILGFIWKDWESGVFIIAAQSIQLAVVSFTKSVAQRNRPPHLTAHKILKSGSYPSGHSASTLSLALLVTVFYSHYLPLVFVGLIFLILLFNALATAYGRLYLDMHWVMDIIGGWLLGTMTTLVTYYLRFYT